MLPNNFYMKKHTSFSSIQRMISFQPSLPKKRKIMSLPRALINITLLQVISHSVTYFRSTTELISYILKFKWPAGDHVQQMLYESNWRLQELYNPISQLPIKYFSVASRGKNIVVSFITIVNKSTYVFRFVLED